MSFGISKLSLNERELVWGFLPRGTQPLNREDRQIQRSFCTQQMGELFCYPDHTLLGRLIRRDPEFRFTRGLLAQRPSEPSLVDTVGRAALTSIKHIEMQAIRRIDFIRTQMSLLDLGIDTSIKTKNLSYHQWNLIEQRFQQHCVDYCHKCEEFLERCRRNRGMDPVLMNQFNEALGFSEDIRLPVEERYLNITKAMLGETVSGLDSRILEIFATTLDANLNMGLLSNPDLVLFIFRESPDLILDIIFDDRVNVISLLEHCFNSEFFGVAERILNSNREIDEISLSFVLSKYCKKNNRRVVEMILRSSQQIGSFARSSTLSWCIENRDLELGAIVLNRAQGLSLSLQFLALVNCIEKGDREFGALILNALRRSDDCSASLLSLALEKCIEKGNQEFGVLVLNELRAIGGYKHSLSLVLDKCIKKGNEKFAAPIQSILLPVSEK